MSKFKEYLEQVNNKQDKKFNEIMGLVYRKFNKLMEKPIEELLKKQTSFYRVSHTSPKQNKYWGIELLFHQIEDLKNIEKILKQLPFSVHFDFKNMELKKNSQNRKRDIFIPFTKEAVEYFQNEDFFGKSWGF